MSKILLAPYSNFFQNKKNPKNYPYWQKVIDYLGSEHEVLQLVCKKLGHPEFRNVTCLYDLNYKQISQKILETDTYMCVDTFLHHLGNRVKKKGVVVFSLSDPEIFGHKSNINILKDRNYLRKDQFNTWQEAEYVEEAFVDPEIVVYNVKKILEDIK